MYTTFNDIYSEYKDYIAGSSDNVKKNFLSKVQVERLFESHFPDVSIPKVSIIKLL